MQSSIFFLSVCMYKQIPMVYIDLKMVAVTQNTQKITKEMNVYYNCFPK